MELNPNEKLIATFRKHWLVIFLEFIIFVFITATPIIFLWLGISSLETGLSPAFSALSQTLCLVWIIIMWIAFFVFYTDYYLDIWILTDQRVIDIEQKGLFSRHVSSLNISNIQDITTKQVGFIPTIFNYGEVHIQTAGVEREFIIHHVHDPKSIRDRIMHEQEIKSQEVKRVQIVT
jgi:uncharacterized membrane protein YdbT with pleckstrin-like domain